MNGSVFSLSIHCSWMIPLPLDRAGCLGWHVPPAFLTGRYHESRGPTSDCVTALMRGSRDGREVAEPPWSLAPLPSNQVMAKSKSQEIRKINGATSACGGRLDKQMTQTRRALHIRGLSELYA